jgi:predicted SAM-dependent methyltransferase
MQLLKQSHLILTLGRTTRSSVAALRTECRRIRLIRGRSGAIDAYLRSHASRKLHLGAGPNALPGWLNTDLDPQSPGIVYLDILEPLPFEGGTFDRIYSEHLIEHVSHEDGAAHLRECCRVLRPGGKIRVSTPSLEFLVALYTRYPDNTPVEVRYIDRTVQNVFRSTGFHHAAFVVNDFFRSWGHQFIYDPRTMEDALRRAGFSNVRRYAVGSSDEPDFRDVEHHGDAISSEFNLMQTAVFEGTRE